MASLFPLPGSVGGGNKPLVEFKAGKMNTSKPKDSAPDSEQLQLSADKRKGLVQLTQASDGLIHFSWKDRTTGNVEDDLIIFPEEAVFKKVKQAETSRILMLEFRATKRRLFFWMQEQATEKDEEHLNKMNEFINNPPVPGQESNQGGMDQNSLFSMLGGGGQSQGRTPQPSSGGNQVGMNDLQSILNGMGMPASMFPPQQSQSTSSQSSASPSTSLAEVLSPERLVPLLSDPRLQEQLVPFLPAERRTPEELQAVVRTPQFAQSLQAFGNALESGQLGHLLQQFGLDPNVRSVEEFLRAVQNSSSSSSSEKKDQMDTQ